MVEGISVESIFVGTQVGFAVGITVTLVDSIVTSGLVGKTVVEVSSAVTEAELIIGL